MTDRPNNQPTDKPTNQPTEQPTYKPKDGRGVRAHREVKLPITVRRGAFRRNSFRVDVDNQHWQILNEQCFFFENSVAVGRAARKGRPFFFFILIP